MKTFFKFILLVVVLNIVRYFVGGPIEGVTIMEPMHEVMPLYPDTFDNDFSTTDFALSFFYNFMMWFTATWVFHIAHPAVSGNMIMKSLKLFGLMCLFFISLAAIYMNHYADPIKKFYLFSMLDAIILFTVVALANGLIYPKLLAKNAAKEISAS